MRDTCSTEPAGAIAGRQGRAGKAGARGGSAGQVATGCVAGRRGPPGGEVVHEGTVLPDSLASSRSSASASHVPPPPCSFSARCFATVACSVSHAVCHSSSSSCSSALGRGVLATQSRIKVIFLSSMATCWTRKTGVKNILIFNGCYCCH